MTRILLAVDDSSGGVNAARTAVRLARLLAGSVRAVHVASDTSAAGTVSTGDLRALGPEVAVLAYVRELAAAEGVPVETALLNGEPARAILDEAADWPADLIVVGRAGRHHVGEHYIGADVKHVLEFADRPVVVVPAA